MPTIFQARCDNCDYASAVFPAEYGAVFVDEPSARESGAVVAGAVLLGEATNADIAEQADPRLVVLAHPIEFEILAKTGYTWTTLAWAGRYVRVQRVVCRDCGTLFDVRQLTSPPGTGCMTGCVVTCISGLVAGAVVGFWKQRFWLGCLAGFWAASVAVLVCMVAVSAVCLGYTRIRFRARARELRGLGGCPRCSSTRYDGAGRRRVYPCPRCSQSAMRVLSVGMS